MGLYVLSPQDESPLEMYGPSPNFPPGLIIRNELPDVTPAPVHVPGASLNSPVSCCAPLVLFLLPPPLPQPAVTTAAAASSATITDRCLITTSSPRRRHRGRISVRRPGRVRPPGARAG